MVASSVDPWWCVNSPYFLNYFNVIMFVFVIKKFKIHLCSTFGLNLASPWGGCQELPLRFRSAHAWENISLFGF